MTIVIIVPTQIEFKAIHFDHPSIQWIVSGMGATATAYTTLKAIHQHHPDTIIQAGIAGAYPSSGLHPTDIVQVSSDHQVDLGAWRGDRFEPFDQPLYNSSITINNIPQVDAQTANTACSPIVVRTPGHHIETMEGAAFLEVCSREQVASLQIRAISNMTNDPRHEWQIEPALKKLKQTLQKLVLKQVAH